MKVELVVDKSIRGEACKAGETVDVGDLVGKWLIDNKFAKALTKPKKESGS